MLKMTSQYFYVPKNGLLITNLTKTLKGISEMNELLLNKIPIRAAQKSKGAACGLQAASLTCLV